MNNFDAQLDLEHLMFQQLRMSLNYIAFTLVMRERREIGDITKEQEVEMLRSMTKAMLSSISTDPSPRD